MAVLDELSPQHRKRLAWFEARAGERTFYPGPLDDGSFLVSRPKGIYKPADLRYALSVRINLNSPYRDGKIRKRGDGSWYFDYHQENSDSSHRDREFTNRALVACIEDAIPVGVLREREVPNNARTEYDVLGLARPVAWLDGYFFFESLIGPDGVRGDTINEVLLDQAEESLAKGEAGESPPTDGYDGRRRVYRQIVARRGQQEFRRQLLDAYSGRCAITGSSTQAVLEAAHLRPYRGPKSNSYGNGLLLRADIHTLFDLRLLAVEPSTRTVVVSRVLADTDYAPLSGVHLREPKAPAMRANQEILAALYEDFVQADLLRQ